MRTTPNVGGLALVALFAGGCTGAAGDTGTAELPPLDTSGWHEDTGSFPFDSAGDTAPIDEAPAHWLTMRQAGTWTLGGAEADPTSMTGLLVVTELLDADEEAPACVETWALVGARAETDCAGCAFTFAVEHTRVATEGACRTPELPDTGDLRTLGYAQAEGRVWWDWYDTGVWVPLWDAEAGTLPGELVFIWEAVIGVAVEEED
ncbi:MAG: hypothetical protein V4850_33580 [Myxococcota bacterium]